MIIHLFILESVSQEKKKRMEKAKIFSLEEYKNLQSSCVLVESTALTERKQVKNNTVKQRKGLRL